MTRPFPIPRPLKPLSNGSVATRRLLLLSSLAYGLFILGLATFNGQVLALVLPVMVYIVASFLGEPKEPRLRVSRTVSAQRVSQGTPVTVRLEIANQGPRLEEVLLEDLLPQPLCVTDGKSQALVSLPRGETVAWEYTVTAERGEIDFRDVRVTASDHLGLFQRQSRASTPGEILVLPRIPRLRRIAIRPSQTRVHTGPVPARRGGSGVEFFGLREYRLGDPYRWINWRASTRHPHALFTNEFEQEHVADVGLILDARRQRNVQANGDSLFEHAVQATAALAEFFLQDGNRVALLVYGWHLDWTFASCGKVQRERILRALARARIVKGARLDYLPIRSFPARSQLVLISSLSQDDWPALVRIRAQGYQLLVVSPDPVAFEAQALESQPGAALAARIARIERELLFRKMRHAGIQIVDWQVDRPLEQAIPASLGRRPYWGLSTIPESI